MPILLGYIYIQGETQKKKYTFLQRNFYPQLLFFTENLIQTVFYWWQGTASSWLVGWSVCGCLPSYINTWWSDLSPLHPCMHTYSEGELDSLVSVTLGKPWFVTDRHLMLQTWLFCVFFISPNPLVTTESPPKGHQLSMIKSRSNEFFDSSVEKKKIRKKCHAMFSGFLIVDYSKRKNYIFTNELDQRQKERMNRRYAMVQINNIFWYKTWIVQYRI